MVRTGGGWEILGGKPRARRTPPPPPERQPPATTRSSSLPRSSSPNTAVTSAGLRKQPVLTPPLSTLSKKAELRSPPLLPLPILRLSPLASNAGQNGRVCTATNPRSPILPTLLRSLLEAVLLQPSPPISRLLRLSASAAHSAPSLLSLPWLRTPLLPPLLPPTPTTVGRQTRRSLLLLLSSGLLTSSPECPTSGPPSLWPRAPTCSRCSPPSPLQTSPGACTPRSSRCSSSPPLPGGRKRCPAIRCSKRRPASPPRPSSTAPCSPSITSRLSTSLSWLPRLSRHRRRCSTSSWLAVTKEKSAQPSRICSPTRSCPNISLPAHSLLYNSHLTRVLLILTYPMMSTLRLMFVVK